MRSIIVLTLCLATMSSVRSEGKTSNGNAGSAQPNMEIPLQAAASSHSKQLRSGGYSMQNYGSLQNYGGNSDSYGGNGGYESSPLAYGFNCYGRAPALYGDGNYDCRIFHVCQADGRQDTLYCPKKTRFNNYLGVCDWEDKIDRTCMPLYKEEYSYNGNSYGSQNYEQGGYGEQQGYSGRRSDYGGSRSQYRRRR
ncbi:uncharacterized protein LOC129591986 [Paramacrobiotus metropolitanus]|uniref:uncharacterized protein LOC129591986 n=1 Tax=Paramacrobiotus metropolitanus TaxID=2943436 RepID=UPI002445D966|nr:uncharacterized protein LOC129591986 [Paramacrobiotus metropolitanus]